MLGARQRKWLLEEQIATGPRALPTSSVDPNVDQVHSTHRIFGLKISNGGQDLEFFPILDSCCFGGIVSVPENS